MFLNLFFWLFVVPVFAVLALAAFRTRRMAAKAETLVPQAGQLQPVTGGVIHYVEMGPKDAPALVLIHGLSGQLQHFTYALTDLLKDEFRLIVIDRPGCGYSERTQAASATPAEQGRMIAEALDALEVENPVLVGHSLGGSVALAMALDQPNKTKALALLCPATQTQGDIPEVFKGLLIKSAWLRRFIGATIAVPMAAATKDKVLGMVFHPEQPPDDFMIRAGAALGLRPKAFVTASEDVVVLLKTGPEQMARYDTELRVPGGVLFGSADKILSPALHGIPMQAHGLTCETIEGRGHMIPMTALDACAEFIQQIADNADGRV